MDDGSKLALAPSAGGPRKAKLELKPPGTPPSALNVTEPRAEDISKSAKTKSKKRKAATGQAVDQAAEAMQRVAKTAKGSKDQTGIQAGAATKDGGAEDSAAQNAGLSAAAAEPLAKGAKGAKQSKAAAASKPLSESNGAANKRKISTEASVGDEEQAPASKRKRRLRKMAASDEVPGSLSPRKMPAISSSMKAAGDWRASNARTDVKRGRYALS